MLGVAGTPTTPTAPTTLTTSWPAAEGCPRYQGVDVSVDDRATSIEWRGADGASLVFDVEKPLKAVGDPEFRLASEGYDCHLHGISCLVYRKPLGRIVRVRVAKASRLLPSDFKPGAFDT